MFREGLGDAVTEIVHRLMEMIRLLIHPRWAGLTVARSACGLRELCSKAFACIIISMIRLVSPPARDLLPDRRLRLCTGLLGHRKHNDILPSIGDSVVAPAVVVTISSCAELFASSKPLRRRFRNAINTGLF